MIVTISHTCLLGVHDPGCDRNAEKFGKKLAKFLGATLLKSNTPRKICDVNRKLCRNDDMRKKLRKMMDAGKVKIVLDVHTFPIHGFPNITDERFVVLAVNRAHTAPQILYKFMNDSMLKTAYGQSSVNDIMAEVSSRSIPCALLEIRDDVKQSTLFYVALVIKSWVRHIT